MDQSKLLLSPEETCAVLGVKRSTLFKMLETHEIPSIKVGRLRKIPSASLAAWVQRQVEEQVGVQVG